MRVWLQGGNKEPKRIAGNPAGKEDGLFHGAVTSFRGTSILYYVGSNSCSFPARVSCEVSESADNETNLGFERVLKRDFILFFKLT